MDQGQTAWGQQCFPFAGAFGAYGEQSNRFDVFSSVVAATKIAVVSVYKAVVVRQISVGLYCGEKGGQLLWKVNLLFLKFVVGLKLWQLGNRDKQFKGTSPTRLLKPGNPSQKMSE